MADEMTDKVDKEVESAKLNIDTGVMAWEELARHFARGVVVCINAELDLVTVGQAMLNDNATLIEQWREKGQFRRASDDDARRWHRESSEFWALVIAPWVIVQEKDKSADTAATENAQLH